MCDCERGSGSEGADRLFLVSWEALGLDLSPNASILVSRLRFEAGIQANMLGFEPWGGGLSPKPGI